MVFLGVSISIKKELSWPERLSINISIVVSLSANQRTLKAYTVYASMSALNISIRREVRLTLMPQLTSQAHELEACYCLCLPRK